MFTVSDISTIDIESINNCNAQCPLCLRGEGMKTNDCLDWDQVIKNTPAELWNNVQHINFNGSTGDNLMHPHIDDIVMWACKNSTALVSVHTNGSLRNTDWWYQFGKQLAEQNHRLVFGIDGLADTHSIYRVGTNWQKVIDNASAFIQGGGKAEWQFIVFKHNSHQIEDARKLSEQLGFSKFFVIFQDRFDANVPIVQQGVTIEKYDQELSTLGHSVMVRTTSNNISTRIAQSDQKINCRSQRIGWISIYADGTVWPCCWLMGWHKAKHQKTFLLVDYHFKKILGIDFSKINLYNNTLASIISSDLWQNRYPSSFTNRPNPICLQQCSGTKE